MIGITNILVNTLDNFDVNENNDVVIDCGYGSIRFTSHAQLDQEIILKNCIGVQINKGANIIIKGIQNDLSLKDYLVSIINDGKFVFGDLNDMKIVDIINKGKFDLLCTKDSFIHCLHNLGVMSMVGNPKMFGQKFINEGDIDVICDKCVFSFLYQLNKGSIKINGSADVWARLFENEGNIFTGPLTAECYHFMNRIGKMKIRGDLNVNTRYSFVNGQKSNSLVKKCIDIDKYHEVKNRIYSKSIPGATIDDSISRIIVPVYGGHQNPLNNECLINYNALHHNGLRWDTSKMGDIKIGFTDNEAECVSEKEYITFEDFDSANDSGEIITNGKTEINVKHGTFDNSYGRIISKQDIKLNASDEVSNHHGTILGYEDVTVNGKKISNQKTIMTVESKDPNAPIKGTIEAVVGFERDPATRTGRWGDFKIPDSAEVFHIDTCHKIESYMMCPPKFIDIDNCIVGFEDKTISIGAKGNIISANGSVNLTSKDVDLGNIVVNNGSVNIVANRTNTLDYGTQYYDVNRIDGFINTMNQLHFEN